MRALRRALKIAWLVVLSVFPISSLLYDAELEGEDGDRRPQ